MKRFLIIALCLLPATARAEDSFAQREKDVARGQEICAKHIQGAQSGGGSFMVTSGTIGYAVPSPPHPVAYSDGWDKCYGVDKMAVDIKQEKEQRDRDFVQALKNAPDLR